MLKLSLLCCLILLDVGCAPLPKGSSEERRQNFNVKIIDGCQYLEYAYGVGTDIGVYSLTHKGDCNNPKHCENQHPK